MKQPVSREYLNAYVDGELAADERALALAQLETDPAFKAEACELRTLKEMVKGAYAELPAAGGGHASRGFGHAWRPALAAVLLLSVGLGGGWFARDRMGGTQFYDRLAGLPDGYQPISLAARVDSNKLVLHLDSGDPKRLDAALDLAERMLARQGAAGRVEIVVNSYGLNMLRTDTSPVARRIEAMARQHANLAFVACGQTVARLAREGVKVELLPVAQTAGSAIGEILDRMRQGWVYVKV